MDQSKQGRARGLLTDELAPETIGFRLDSEHRKLLAQRCRKAGASPHDLARSYVTDALHDRDQLPAIKEAIISLDQKINELHARLALAVEAILVTANDVDEGEA